MMLETIAVIIVVALAAAAAVFLLWRHATGRSNACGQCRNPRCAHHRPEAPDDRPPAQ